MSHFTPLINRELISRVEQFYYREARLLDNREAQQWMLLVAEDIIYTLPSRHIPQPDASLRGTEAFQSPDLELERPAPDMSPLREENIFQLAIRIDRLYKVNAWAENPAPRTRRFITNIEVAAGLEDNSYTAYSNFQLLYSRHANDTHTYSGQRRDTLREVDGDFKIARREIILDCNVITVPTLGLIF